MKFLEAGATMVDVYNAVREEASYAYQNAVDVATPDNIFTLTELLEQKPQLANEFADTLINKVGLTQIFNRRYKNEMAPLHKGMLRKGKTIENVFIEIAELKAYDPESGETCLRRELPDIRAAYNIITDKKYVKQTMSRQQLKEAVTDLNDLDRIFDSIVSAMYNQLENYDSAKVKQLLTTVVNKQQVAVCITEPVVDKTTADAAAIAINTISDNMTILSPDYNYAKVHNFCPKENQILILNTAYKNKLNMMVLAQNFNIEYAKFNQYMTIYWRDFGPLSALGVWGFVGSKDCFQIWDSLMEMPEPLRNPQSLDVTYFIHRWTLYGWNPFECGCILTDKMPVISEYTITPKTTSIGKGDSAKFTITVSGEGVMNADSIFEISGQKSSSTFIDEFGYLYVGTDETAPTITVKATSKLDSTKTATATVTVTGNEA